MRQAWITKDYEETFGDDMFITLILVIVSHVYTYVKSYKIVHVKYILLTVLWLYHKRNVNKTSYYWQTENKISEPKLIKLKREIDKSTVIN